MLKIYIKKKLFSLYKKNINKYNRYNYMWINMEEYCDITVKKKTEETKR